MLWLLLLIRYTLRRKPFSSYVKSICRFLHPHKSCHHLDSLPWQSQFVMCSSTILVGAFAFRIIFSYSSSGFKRATPSSHMAILKALAPVKSTFLVCSSTTLVGAFAFSIISSYSSSGFDSATIAPPAPTEASPS